MKRLIIRLSALSVVVVLGLIAIAQAQRGAFDQDTPSEPTVSIPRADLPRSAPPPVRQTAASAPRAEASLPSANPLRVQPPLDVSKTQQTPSRLGRIPTARSISPSANEIPSARSLTQPPPRRDVVRASAVESQSPTDPSSAIPVAPPVATDSRYGDSTDDSQMDEPPPALAPIARESLVAGDNQPTAPPSDRSPPPQVRSDDRYGARGDGPTAAGNPSPVAISPTLVPVSPDPSSASRSESPSFGRSSPPVAATTRDQQSQPAPVANANARAASTRYEAPQVLESPRDLEPVRPSAENQSKSVLRNTAPADKPLDEVASPSVSGQHSLLATGEGTGLPGASALEGAQAPTLTIEKTAPPEVQVGKECKFEIRVRNIGQVAARGVEIRDVVPKGTTLVSTSPRATPGGSGQIVWSLGTLEPGQEELVELLLMPLSEGELGSVATLHFQAQASASTQATRPELELKSVAPAQVMIGEDVRINIQLGNPGSGVATGVMLVESVPDGLTHPAGESLEFEIGALSPGETRELELTLTAKQAGKFTNTLMVVADANLQVEDSVEVEVVAPQLAVDVSGPERRYLERTASYDFAVSNPGTASASDITLTAHLPKGLKFVSADKSGQYDPSSHTVAWGLTELPAKQSGSVTLVAIPLETGEQVLQVEGKAAQGLADKAEQTISVEGLAAIKFEVVDIEDPIEVGGETTYEIRVVNQGTKAADNVQITALLPRGLEAVSADGPTTGHRVDKDRVVFTPLRRLGPKADATFVVKVLARGAGDQRLRVELLTDDLQTPVAKEESTNVFSNR